MLILLIFRARGKLAFTPPAIVKPRLAVTLPVPARTAVFPAVIVPLSLIDQQIVFFMSILMLFRTDTDTDMMIASINFELNGLYILFSFIGQFDGKRVVRMYNRPTILQHASYFLNIESRHQQCAVFRYNKCSHADASFQKCLTASQSLRLAPFA